MPDTEKLKQAVQHFQHNSRPSNASGNTPCTAQDLNKVIKNISQLMYEFIEELEK